ncbi:MAG TPA: sulfite exporter TauE/SafE family protein [Thermohalobaculum sp.]|nr:sulfite exporter TauE/SafE family protein [Thermohalobaculum sp.]
MIGATVVATSFLSGIFGMAGGIILLGVLLVFLDVAQAMVLFGAIQTVANGWRAALWRHHARWDIVWRYVIGSALAFAVLRSIAFVPDKAVVYLAIGILPFAVYALPKRLAPDITRPRMPQVCGAVVMLVQLFGGAAGHILDQFFQASPMDRRAVVATKAMTQTVAHLFRIAYFGSFAAAFDVVIPWWVYAGAMALAMLGTTLAAQVLERMTDTGFRLWSKRIVIAVCIVYIARGLWLAAG